MNWTSQLRHLVINDVRHRSWALFVYLVLVVIATWTGTLSEYSVASTSAWPLLIVLFGMVTIASIVQGDSPARADAFWVSKPIRPSAMAAAKLAAAIGLLAIGLAGQWAALVAQDAPSRLLPELLLSSTESYGMLLLVAMLLSSLTADLRSFIVAMLCGAVTLVILSGAGAGITWLPGASFLRLLGPVAGLSFIAMAYHTRDNPFRVRLAAAGTILCIWISTLASNVPPGIDAALPASVVRTPLTIAFPGMKEGVRPESGPLSSRLELSLVLTMEGAPSTERRILSRQHASVILANGTRKVLQLGGVGGVLSRGDSVATSYPMRWINSGSLFGGGKMQVSALLDDEMRTALRDGAKRVEIEGTVEVWKGKGDAMVALRKGTTLAHDGTRVRIGEVNVSPNGIRVLVTVTEIGGAGDTPWSRWGLNDAPRFALVNRERGEAIALSKTGGGGGGLGLVLPGVNTTRGSYELAYHSEPQSPASPTLDAAWIAGAKLMMIDWTRVGSYPVKAELAAH